MQDILEARNPSNERDKKICSGNNSEKSKEWNKKWEKNG